MTAQPETVPFTSTEGRFIREDWQRGTFRVHRDAFRSQEVFDLEQRTIWSAGWLYLGHATELLKPGDYKVRKIGGRPLIFLRDSEGDIRAFYNSCPHRGTAICREEQGNSKHLRCFYHAWTFDTQGRLVSLPGPEAYPGGDDFRDRLGLRPVAHLEIVHDFVFISFNPEVEPLRDYLGEAVNFFELISQHSESGMRVLPGTQRYTARANWKLLVENAIDGYHFVPSHITFLDYLKKSGYTASDEGGTVQILGKHMESTQLNHGGRIGLSWEPRFGEDERERTEANRDAIWKRLGEVRGKNLTDGFHTLMMFPNLLFFDIESPSVRMLEPVGPNLTEVTAWALAPNDEPESATSIRLRTLTSFIGPGGLATPDDLEAQESMQRSYVATAGDTREGVDWNDVSRGMDAEANGEILVPTEEAGVRHFWRTWDAALRS